MDKSLWLDDERPLRESFEAEQYPELLDYSDSNRFNLFAIHADGDIDFLRKSLRLGSAILQRFSRYLQKKSEQLFAVYRLGVLSGIVECMNHILYEEAQQLASITRHGREVLYIKHVPQILSALEDEGTLTHSELCNRLNLKPSTLTEIMKRIAPERLFNYVSSGKYKLYSLTDDGRRYARQLRKEDRSDDGIEHMERQLIRFIDQSNDPEKIRRQIVDQLLDLNAKRMTIIQVGERFGLTQVEKSHYSTHNYEILNILDVMTDSQARKHITVREVIEDGLYNNCERKGA